MIKTYHDVTLKCGHRIVMARTKFHFQFGHNLVPKGQPWDTVKYTVSKDGDAVSGFLDRQKTLSDSIKSVKYNLKMAKRKLATL